MVSYSKRFYGYTVDDDDDGLSHPAQIAIGMFVLTRRCCFYRRKFNPYRYYFRYYAIPHETKLFARDHDANK